MALIDKVDPESRVPLDAMNEAMPGGFCSIKDLAARRAALDDSLRALAAELPVNPHVATRDEVLAWPEGAEPLRVRIYRPSDATGPLPGILFIHGGGMVMGSLDSEHHTAVGLCDAIRAVVVSVDYRLAPEHPAPAAIEDCYRALVWMHENAERLGFDRDRLALYGGSAGGGLAIATALMARDRDTHVISYVMALYPMIDDRNETESSHAVVDLGIWDRAGNIEAWAWYLGGLEPTQYSAPARATDLTGLPPMFIDIGDCDLFLDETRAFAEGVRRSGGEIEFIEYPGAYHASEVFAPEAALSRTITSRRMRSLKDAFAIQS